jgi:hypothetical protein
VSTFLRIAPARLTLALALLGLAACRAELPAPAAGHAQCPVCRCHGDLACLDVEIGPDTPRVELDGVVHWFCSGECRDDFLRGEGR